MTVGSPRFPRGCRIRSEEHTSELQSLRHLVCRLLLEKINAVVHLHAWNSPRRLALKQRAGTDVARVAADSFHLIRSFFFLNDPATTEIYPLSLHDALPICRPLKGIFRDRGYLASREEGKYPR